MKYFQQNWKISGFIFSVNESHFLLLTLNQMREIKYNLERSECFKCANRNTSISF